MASSVEVSLEEVRRGREAGEEEGVEEDWQERRDRLGLGNRVVCYFSLDPSVWRTWNWWSALFLFM
jgi:hypothetical protein